MKIVLGLIVFFMSIQIALAGVYKWTDVDGNVYFSDNKPAATPVKELKITPYIGDPSSGHLSPRVVMYSTDWCGYCRRARRYFRANDIDFVDYDIEKDKSAKRRYDRIGGRGVPVILVGDKRMNGFSQRRFDSIYP